MSDLRTRIAAVLYDHWWHGTMTPKEPPVWEKLSESSREAWLHQADAVIRELRQMGCPAPDSGWPGGLEADDE